MSRVKTQAKSDGSCSADKPESGNIWTCTTHVALFNLFCYGCCSTILQFYNSTILQSSSRWKITCLWAFLYQKWETELLKPFYIAESLFWYRCKNQITELKLCHGRLDGPEAWEFADKECDIEDSYSILWINIPKKQPFDYTMILSSLMSELI